MKKSSLQLHINRHHGKEEVMCKEPGCGKVFKHPSVLKEHMLTHKTKDLLQVKITFRRMVVDMDSFITQDRNEQIKGVKVEATFSRGHISLI